MYGMAGTLILSSSTNIMLDGGITMISVGGVYGSTLYGRPSQVRSKGMDPLDV